jgi:hypothetical protein
MSGLAALGGASIVVIEAAAAIFVAWRVSRSLVESGGSPTLRLVTAFVIGLTQILGVQMLCAAVDALYVPVVLVLHLGIALVVWTRVPALDRSERTNQRLDARSISLWAVLAFAAIVAILMSTRVPSDPDSVQYHIPNAASWLQVHNLWHLPATNPGYFTNGYPSDGELITSWIIQPLHQAQWSAWPSLPYGIAILAGAALVSEELGGSPTYGLLAGAAVLLSPLSWTAQIGTAFTDWISLGGLIMAVGLVLHARTRLEWRWTLLAGLALGIAVGSKDTALLPAVLVIALGVATLPRTRRIRGCALMLAGVAALSGIWFVRDAIQTGNPLYPEPVRVAGRTFLHGGVGPVTAWSSSVLRDLFTANGSALKIWVETFAVWIGPAVILCAGAVLCLTRWKRRNIRTLIAAMAGIWFIFYLATPYTGPSSFPLLIASQVRYGLSAMTLAAVCASVESRWWRAVAWIAVGYDLWAILRGVHLSSVPEAVMRTPRGAFVAVALAGALVVMVLLVRLQSGVSRRMIAGAPPLAVRGAALTLAVCICGAMSIVAVRHAPVPSQLDVALASSGRPTGPVMIDGDGDVLGAMGNKLQHHVVSAGGGGASHQVPLLSRVLLDARVRSVDPAAVIVGPTNWPGVIPGWTPPGYHLLYDQSGHRVYVKDTMFAELSGSKRTQP